MRLNNVASPHERYSRLTNVFTVATLHDEESMSPLTQQLIRQEVQNVLVSMTIRQPSNVFSLEDVVKGKVSKCLPFSEEAQKKSQLIAKRPWHRSEAYVRYFRPTQHTLLQPFKSGFWGQFFWLLKKFLFN